MSIASIWIREVTEYGSGYLRWKFPVKITAANEVIPTDYELPRIILSHHCLLVGPSSLQLPYKTLPIFGIIGQIPEPNRRNQLCSIDTFPEYTL